MTKSRKIHAADAASRARIADAVSFNVHLRISPQVKINEAAATLEEAGAIRHRIVTAERPNRRPVVYAILADGASIPVPADMLPAIAAEAPAETIPLDAASDEAGVPAFLKRKGRFAEAVEAAEAVVDAVVAEAPAGAPVDWKAVEGEARGRLAKGKAAKDAKPAKDAKDAKIAKNMPAGPQAHRPARGQAVGAIAKAVAKLAKPQAVKTADAAAEADEQAIAQRRAETQAAKRPAGAPRMRKTHLAALEAAKAGHLPTPPDFTAETHKRFRTALAALVAAAEAGDLAAVKAIEINPISSSRQAMHRYQGLVIAALEARQ